VNRQSRLFLPLVLTAGMLAACATPAAKPGDPVAATASLSKEDCIFSAVVSDWAELDREHLILYGPGRQQPYLVQLSFPSSDLPFNMAIGVIDADSNGRICGYGFDSIAIPGGMPSRITIRSIQKLTPDEAKQMIAAAHPKREPKGKPAAAPVVAKPAG
jgi:hypothetical protein